MYCSIHPSIETPKNCKKCFESWPIKTGYTRAQCKRKNWCGKVDHKQHNDIIKNKDIKEVY